MNGTVLDILIYVFDRYMLSDGPRCPSATNWRRISSARASSEANVERALDWLADLAGERDRNPAAHAAGASSMRIYTDSELRACRPNAAAICCQLERTGILSPLQREIVIDRLLALESEELTSSSSSGSC
jgi:Smg protein